MRFTVPPVVDELYPENVALLAIHLSDPPYTTTFGNARRNAYWPGSITIPRSVFDCDSVYIGSSLGMWQTNIDARLAIPTDVTIEILPQRDAPGVWTFTADVCMEPTGTARDMGVWFAYTLEDYPDTYPYRYRKTLRNGAGPTPINLTPGNCVQVQQTFTFSTTIDLGYRRPGIDVVAWAQTPVSGFGEAYQAEVLSFTLLTEGMDDTGDLSGWSTVVTGP